MNALIDVTKCFKKDCYHVALRLNATVNEI